MQTDIEKIRGKAEAIKDNIGNLEGSTQIQNEISRDFDELLGLLPPPCKHYKKDKGCEVWCRPPDEEVPQYIPCKGYSACPDYLPKPCERCGGLEIICKDGIGLAFGGIAVSCPDCQAPAIEEFVKAERMHLNIGWGTHRLGRVIERTENSLSQALTYLTAQAKQSEFLDRRVCKDDALLKENDKLKQQIEQFEGKMKVLEEMLKSAKCPEFNCDNGLIKGQAYEGKIIGNCQWCEKRDQALQEKGGE